MSPTNISDASAFLGGDDMPAQRIKVIGVGGGGNNAVDHMFNQGIKDVSFVLINTDRPVLAKSKVPTRILIGPGLGAGGRPERARQYAEENADRIAELLDDDIQMVFITAGMGGGTGTGAAPVVARIAKQLGILTIGVVTLPFRFEGEPRIVKALEGADELRKNVDALLIINNERLNEIYPDLHILNAFARANDTLLNATQGITEIITSTGIINRDFHDVDTTLRDGGTAIISSGIGTGENRVTKAIEDALHSPLLSDTDIFSSKRLLIAVYVSDNPDYPFEMAETNQITEFVSNLDPQVEVMWGLYSSSELTEQVKITILASGFELTVRHAHPVGESGNKPTPIKKSPEERQKDIETLYGTKNHGSRHRIIPVDKLDDDATIEDMSRPAYNRSRHRSSIVRSTPRPEITDTHKNINTEPTADNQISFDDLK